jgi:hypothetical protein
VLPIINEPMTFDQAMPKAAPPALSASEKFYE